MIARLVASEAGHPAPVEWHVALSIFSFVVKALKPLPLRSDI